MILFIFLGHSPDIDGYITVLTNEMKDEIYGRAFKKNVIKKGINLNGICFVLHPLLFPFLLTWNAVTMTAGAAAIL